MIKIICKICGKKFSASPSRIKTKKYCSNPCRNKSMIGGHIGKEIQKGQHLSPKTEFKKGQPCPNFKGFINVAGYIYIYQPKNHRATKNGYVKRSILVAEKTFNHSLKDNEIVHHINKNKSDDRPQNLIIMTRNKHMALHKNSKGYKWTKKQREKLSKSLLGNQNWKGK